MNSICKHSTAILLVIFATSAWSQSPKKGTSPAKSKEKAKPPAKSKRAIPATTSSGDMILVVGAPGEQKFGDMFNKWAGRWRQAAQQGKLLFSKISRTRQQSPRIQLRNKLAKLHKDGLAPLWIVYIGHGTFDRNNARLNVYGRDVSAKELAQWLDEFTRPVVFIHSGAASAPFINRLSRPGRIIVTATKSGYEYNFAYFGDFISAAINDPKADLDKDHQTSLLEAYLMASRRVAEFYKQNGRLATEQALLDDNGDARGTPASFFRGIRVDQKANQGQPDGLRANQIHLVKSPTELALPANLRAQRDDLEQQLEVLRSRKKKWPADKYYIELEKIAVRIAELYEGTSSRKAAR